MGSVGRQNGSNGTNNEIVFQEDVVGVGVGGELLVALLAALFVLFELFCCCCAAHWAAVAVVSCVLRN